MRNCSEQTRILHVITRMVRGGAQESTLAITRGVGGGGWESALATGPSRGPEGSMEADCEAAGLRLRRLPNLVREVSPRQDAVALQQLLTLFRRERPHIVHTHTAKAGALGRIAARCARVPIVIHTPHGHVFHGYGGHVASRGFLVAERLCARLADRLVAITATERREHLGVGVGSPDQWVVMHSGVDFRAFEQARGTRDTARAALGLSHDAVVLGTVGRLVPIKGQHVLIDAFARLAAERRNASGRAAVHLLLVGDGPLRESLIARARKQGLRVAVHPEDKGLTPLDGGPVLHVLGLRRDIPRLLSAMDLFILPSLNEGMGRVLVEAMAVGLPCVASKVSGTQDVVGDDVTGLLVPPGDVDALVTAIRTLVAHPHRAREMGRCGRRKVNPEFSVERMLRQHEDLYRELLEEKRLPVPTERALIARKEWNGCL